MNEKSNLPPLTSQNAEKPGMKAITQADGQTILFQKEVEPPTYEPLEDTIDEISIESEIIENTNETDRELYEKGMPNELVEINDQGNSELLLSNLTNLKAPEDVPPALIKGEENEQEEEQNDNDEQNYSSKSSKSASSSAYSSEVNSRRQSPLFPSKITISDAIQKKSPKAKTPQKPKSPIQNQQKNQKVHNDSNFYMICGYCLLILSIILFIALYNQDTEDPLLRSNEVERELVFKLNDCVSPIKSVSAKSYSVEFLRYIQKCSIYLTYNETDETIVAKKPLKSLFCKAVEFGDHHPDLGGMFIVWLVMFIFYVWYRISRSRAEKIVPIIYNILESDNGHMCYIDDARKKIKSNGVSIFGAWWQVMAIINKNKNIRTVKMVDAKPFWSLNKN